MTPAIERLRKAGAPHEVRSYTHDPACRNYGEEAARALGLPASAVLKTLIVCRDGNPASLACLLVPVSCQLDLKAAARALGCKKTELAPAAVAERSSGYLTGGISPLGQKRQLPTLIDSSAQAHARIWVSGGRRGLELGLAPADLAALCNARLVPLTRSPDRE